MGAKRRTGCQPIALLGLALLLALLWSVSVLLGVSLGAAPMALADGGAPNLAYVAGAGANGEDLAIIDIGQRQETGHVTIGGAPTGVILSADSRFAYVTERAANRVAVVDTRAKQVTATIAVGAAPTAIAIDPNPSPTTLYVVNSGSNTLAILNGETHSVVATLPVGAQPSGVAVAASNSGIANTNDEEVYVANSGGNSVSVVSVTQRRVIATIPAPGAPLAVTIPSSGGGVAYVTTRSGAVLAISLSAHRLLGTLWQAPGAPAGAQLGVMDYAAVTGQVYVPEAATGQLAILAPATDSGAAPPVFPAEPTRTLAFGGAPAAVAITFEGSYGFVAEHASGQVAIFDATTHHTLGVVTVGGAPSGVVTGAYPPLLGRQQSFYAGVAVIIVLVVLMVWAIVSLARNSRQQARRRAAAPAETQTRPSP